MTTPMRKLRRSVQVGEDVYLPNNNYFVGLYCFSASCADVDMLVFGAFLP